jgi:hypothetical protein
MSKAKAKNTTLRKIFFAFFAKKLAKEWQSTAFLGTIE